MISQFHNVESEVRLGTRPELRYKTKGTEMPIQVDQSISWKVASYLNTKSKCNGMCMNACFLVDQETF